MRKGNIRLDQRSSAGITVAILTLAHQSCITPAPGPPRQAVKSTYTFAAAAQQVVNLATVLERIKEQSKVPVFFPARVPLGKAGVSYFASGSVEADGKRYTINVDSSPDCNGAKFCRLGGIYAVAGQSPQHYTGADNQQTLSESIAWGREKHAGLFTPSHAKADYWPAMLEWQEGGVLYHLDWKLAERSSEKATLVSLAESLDAKAKPQATSLGAAKARGTPASAW